jgi:small-conductance mechanosensitive channel
MWTAVEDFLFWAPAWLSGVAVLLIAALAALLVHALLFTLLRRALDARRTFALRLLVRTKQLSRFALSAAALSVASAWAPFTPALSDALARLLMIAFIVLAGWILLVAVAIASDIYLQRFRLDSPDNLLARKHVTQVRILVRAANVMIVLVTVSAALMTFEPVRQYGVSLFASAGVAGLAVGLAARPMLSNLIAGIQIATAQPIRLADEVIVENEAGTVEEITSTYVVVRLWDLRRLIVPLSYFIEKPFQNWSRESTNLIGSVFLYVDYAAPVARIRDKLNEIVKTSPLWDGRVVKLQVTDAKDHSMELRALASARTPGEAFDLRCEIREKLIDFLQRRHPQALPRARLLPLPPDRNGAARGREAKAASG